MSPQSLFRLFVYRLAASFRTALVWGLVGSLCGGGIAAANPEGHKVVAGNVNIVQIGNQLDVNQTSNKAIVDWRSFSIDAGETTLITQPSENSVSLHRVTGSDASTILGRLSSNGQVILSNPNGIMTGRDSTVDVASLVLTTSSISSADFMSADPMGATRTLQELRFGETDGSGPMAGRIVTEGLVSVADGGLAALVAPWVVNQGEIVAQGGRIQIGAAEVFTLDLFGDGLLEVAVGSTAPAQMGIEHGKGCGADPNCSAALFADGGTIQIDASAAVGILNNVINLEGYVQARTVEQVAGRILLHGNDSETTRVQAIVDVTGTTANDQGGVFEADGNTVLLETGTEIIAQGGLGDTDGDGTPETIIGAGGKIRLGLGLSEGDDATTVRVKDGANLFAQGGSGASSGSSGGGTLEVMSTGELEFGGFFGGEAIATPGSGSPVDGGSASLDGGSVAMDGLVALTGAQGGRGGELRVRSVSIEVGETTGVTGDAVSNALLFEGNVTLVADAGNLVVDSEIDGRLDGGSSGALSLYASGNVEQNANILLSDAEMRVAAGVDPESLTSPTGPSSAGFTGNFVMTDADLPGGEDPVIDTGNGALTLQGDQVTLQKLFTSGAVAVEATSTTLDSSRGTAETAILLDEALGFTDANSEDRLGPLSLVAASGKIDLNELRVRGLTTQAPITDVDGQIDSDGRVQLGQEPTPGASRETVILRGDIFTSGEDIVIEGDLVFAPAQVLVDDIELTSSDLIVVDDCDVFGDCEVVDRKIPLRTFQVTLDTIGAGSSQDAGNLIVMGAFDIIEPPPTPGGRSYASLQLNLGAGTASFAEGIVPDTDVESARDVGGDDDIEIGFDTMSINVVSASNLSGGRRAVLNGFSTPAGGPSTFPNLPVEIISNLEIGLGDGNGNTPPETPSPSLGRPGSRNPGGPTNNPGDFPSRNDPGGRSDTNRNPSDPPSKATALSSKEAEGAESDAVDRQRREEGEEDEETELAQRCGPQPSDPAFQTTPAAAAFQGNAQGNGYSVDVFCGEYALVDSEPNPAFGTLSYLSQDFWTDLERGGDWEPGAGVRSLPSVAAGGESSD